MRSRRRPTTGRPQSASDSTRAGRSHRCGSMRGRSGSEAPCRRWSRSSGLPARLAPGCEAQAYIEAGSPRRPEGCRPCRGSQPARRPRPCPPAPGSPWTRRMPRWTRRWRADSRSSSSWLPARSPRALGSCRRPPAARAPTRARRGPHRAAERWRASASRAAERSGCCCGRCSCSSSRGSRPGSPGPRTTREERPARRWTPESPWGGRRSAG
mmetsp:Transcript_91760/g.256281  ORF Transcript_91760/g.256281 Transcript_91760/m.256281 type:complete len:212 (+) Transcript_91760:1480-2115(+)